jgi:uncharacterized lipoprotein YehR (DUF1307 family)
MQAYYSALEDALYKTTYKDGRLENTEITEDDAIEFALEIRQSRKNPYSWDLSPEVFENHQSSKEKHIQFNISNENDHLILSMRFNSISDKNNDVVILNFRPELSFFGIEGGRIKMNTENKTMIANLLYKSSVAVLSQANEDHHNLNLFANKTKTAINSVKLYKEKLKQLRQEHHKNTVSIAQSFITGLSQKYCVDFIFTDESIESLKNFSSNLPRLQNIVENAAIYAYNLNSFNKSKTIIIEEEYLEYGDSDILEKPTHKTVNTNSIRPDRKERAEKMLERIELAVKRVLANKERITGVTVGKAFERPISAAAITDYLKKHFNEINEILESNPSKYPESRRYFRPLQNIIIIPQKKISKSA